MVGTRCNAILLLKPPANRAEGRAACGAYTEEILMFALTEHESSSLRTRARLAFAVFLAVAASLLVLEHWAHVVPFIPWLLLAACPLMHMFMHRGHGHHTPRTSADTSTRSEAQPGGARADDLPVEDGRGDLTPTPPHHHGG